MDDLTAVLESRAKADEALDKIIAYLKAEIADKQLALEKAEAARGPIDPPPRPRKQRRDKGTRRKAVETTLDPTADYTVADRACQE